MFLFDEFKDEGEIELVEELSKKYHGKKIVTSQASSKHKSVGKQKRTFEVYEDKQDEARENKESKKGETEQLEDEMIRVITLEKRTISKDGTF